MEVKWRCVHSTHRILSFEELIYSCGHNSQSLKLLLAPMLSQYNHGMCFAYGSLSHMHSLPPSIKIVLQASFFLFSC
jgi:hypothetical protein